MREASGAFFIRNFFHLNIKCQPSSLRLKKPHVEVDMERKVKIAHKGKEKDGIDLDFKTLKEEWNEYDLEDGSRIRLKSVISNIVKVPNEFDEEGNPVYVVRSTNILAVSSPDYLRKGAAKKPGAH